jgi:hypothetical protein
MRISWLAFLACVVGVGCSNPPPPPAPPQQHDPNFVQIDPLTAVLPGRPTHLCVSDSLTAFVQETDNGLDTVYQISPMDMAAATDLTTTSVAAALGKPDARGNFQDLAADGTTIYFYFVGSYKHMFLSCLGRLNPSGKIEILADQKRLGKICGVGDSISIYTGQLARSGDNIWFWLHSEDGSHFLLIDPTSTDPATRVGSPFDRLTTDLNPPAFTRESYALSGDADGGMLILDYWSGILWQITTEGYAKPLHNFTGLPAGASAPVLDADGNIAVFFAGTDTFAPRSDSQEPEQIPITQFPALILFKPDKTVTFSTPKLLTNGGFAVTTLQFTSMCARADGKAMIAYDPGAGEIFRLRLVIK